MAKHPQKREPRNPAPPANHQQQVLSAQWSGPLPHPADLEHFERAIPGGAARILQMAEAEQAHRISTEQTVLKAATSDHRRGQWLGAGIAAAAIIGSVIAAVMGAPWQVSVALVGVPILGVVHALIPWGKTPGE